MKSDDSGRAYATGYLSALRGIRKTIEVYGDGEQPLTKSALLEELIRIESTVETVIEEMKEFQ